MNLSLLTVNADDMELIEHYLGAILFIVQENNPNLDLDDAKVTLTVGGCEVAKEFQPM